MRSYKRLLWGTEQHGERSITMIDDCPHSLPHLTEVILPQYLEELTAAPLHSASDFGQPGRGSATLARRHGFTSDFQGLYVFYDGSIPQYVGISRGVMGRLRQHVCGRTQFDASLAYSMAAKAASHVTGSREQRMQIAEFTQAFRDAQDRLRAMQVKFLKVDDVVTLYLLEVWVAMSLGTREWNTFRTH